MDGGDLLRWGAATVTLLGLGLSMGFSPALYGVALRLLVHDQRPVPAIHGLVGGLFAGSTLLLLIFQIVDPENLERLLRHRVDALLLRMTVDIVAGALLIIAAVILALRDHQDRLRPAHHDLERHPSNTDRPERSWHAFVVGLANTLLGISGIATMYLTGRVISGASTDLLMRCAFYGVFVITLVGPYLVVAGLWARFPAFAARVRHGYERVSGVDLRKPVAVVLLLAGVGLIGFGLLYGVR